MTAPSATVTRPMRQPYVTGKSEAAVLQGSHAPRRASEATGRTTSRPNSLTGVGLAVLDSAGRVLLGLGHDGRWELPDGKVDAGADFETAAAREPAEETGLMVPATAVRALAVLVDGLNGLARVTAAAVTESATGTPRVTEPNKIVRWDWFARAAVPSALLPLSASVLDCLWPEAEPRGTAGFRHYGLHRHAPTRLR